MIAASLKEAAGDPIVDLLLKRGADVNVKSVSGQVSLLRQSHFVPILADVFCRMLCTSPVPRPTFLLSGL
jgi:26S proteasome non-ATPase regulatory subunit 10